MCEDGGMASGMIIERLGRVTLKAPDTRGRLKWARGVHARVGTDASVAADLG
jgi:hypothetical protein